MYAFYIDVIGILTTHEYPFVGRRSFQRKLKISSILSIHIILESAIYTAKGRKMDIVQTSVLQR
jgi:hypothetical protein